MAGLERWSHLTARAACTIVACGLLSGTASAAGDAPLATPWVAEPATRVRVVAGTVSPGEARGAKIYAGLEIELDDGWKTYWRNPGSSGVPPRVDLAGSENLAKAELLFPAPSRFTDRDGDIIGYKKHVVLPVALTPVDPSKPIVLKVAAEFGICREVCIPVQPELGLTVPAGAAIAPASESLRNAIRRVPRNAAVDSHAPQIEHVASNLKGDQPQVVIDVRFPGEHAQGDIFLEAPEGLWIPLPQAKGEVGKGVRRFVVDLADGADVKDLLGRRIRATLVGATGQSETTFDLVDSN